MILTNTLSFVIPVRVDSLERIENLKTVLFSLKEIGSKVFIIEADKEPILQDKKWIRTIEYQFVHDTNPLFHRTMYINKLLSMANTEMIGIWDTDVLVMTAQIVEAIKLIEQGCTISYPYNGEFVMLNEIMSKRIRKSLDFDYLKGKNFSSFRGRQSCGGAYVIDRKRYLDCGAENEYYRGWGLEDEERRHRVEILGHKTKWISEGKLYHLYHPIGCNSHFWSEEYATHMREEFIKECSFSKKDMEYYIQNSK